jgi:hypothetical protein
VNYREGSFDDTDKVDAIAVANESHRNGRLLRAVPKKRSSRSKCAKKTPASRKGVRSPSTRSIAPRGPEVRRPGYESLAALGTNLGVGIVALQVERDLQLLGMDVSAGSTIAWAGLRKASQNADGVSSNSAMATPS